MIGHGGPAAFSDEASVGPGRYLQTVGGFTLSQARLQQVYDSLTRDVALALRDPDVRAMVYAQLHASSYPEHKVHFRTFLANQGKALLSGVASVRDVTPDAALLTLDSLVDFEFYMPRQSQWKAWTGGADLVVANELDEDGALPVGFDLSGATVQFVSHSSGPTTPTLAIVPVETDFSRPAAAAPEPQRSAEIVSPGIYMTSDYISDLHESWLKGAPEIEIHGFVRGSAGYFWHGDLQCAGESGVGSLYRFNQDDHAWSGSAVKVISDTAIGYNPVEISIWEDDDPPCGYQYGTPPKVGSGTLEEFGDWGARSMVNSTLVPPGYNVVAFDNMQVPIILAPDGGQSDDEIGEARPPSCWPSSGPATFALQYSEASHGSNGWVDLDVRFGQRGDVCDPPPATLTVSIAGPTRVKPNTYCYYSASVSGGTSPYSYSWIPGYETTQGVEIYTGMSSFEVDVLARDALGAWGSKSKSVTVTESAPECPM